MRTVSRPMRRLRLVATALSILGVAACGSAVAPEDFAGPGGTASVATGSGTVIAPGTDTGVAPTAAATEPATAATDVAPGDTTQGGGKSGSGGSTNPNAGQATPTADAQAASCDGFKNGPGIDDHFINIGTTADLTGAQPNIFKDAADAMTAYVAHFNSTSSICGRKLKLHIYDSGLTAAGDHSADQAACDNFALVGSMGGFDSGGAPVTTACGQPDFRNTATTLARFDSPNTFPVYSLNPRHPFLEPWAWAKTKNPGMIKHSAFVYLNAGAAETDASYFMKGTREKLGYKWEKTVVVDLTSVPNWNAIANELKSAHIEFVTSILNIDTARLKVAFAQADYHPFMIADNSAYTPGTIGTGSQVKAMEGMYVYNASALLSEVDRNPEMQTYEAWLQRTGGGEPDAEGMFSWSAGVLFTQVAQSLGGKLTRESLMTAVKKVHRFTGNGLMTPMNPGQKKTGPCVSMIQIHNGEFVRVSPYPYICGPLG